MSMRTVDCTVCPTLHYRSRSILHTFRHFFKPEIAHIFGIYFLVTVMAVTGERAARKVVRTTHFERRLRRSFICSFFFCSMLFRFLNGVVMLTFFSSSCQQRNGHVIQQQWHSSVYTHTVSRCSGKPMYVPPLSPTVSQKFPQCCLGAFPMFV